MWWAALGVSSHQLLAVESSLAWNAGRRTPGWLVLPSRAWCWAGCSQLAEVTLAMIKDSMDTPINLGSVRKG